MTVYERLLELEKLEGQKFDFDGLMETCIEQIDREWNDAFEITMLNVYMDLVLE